MSAAKRIAIWGGGGHGHVVADLLRAVGGWDIAGFIDSVNPPGTRIMDLPVLGDADILPGLPGQGIAHIVTAIGDCGHRARMIAQARGLGLQIPTIIHPSCILYPSAVIGAACVLCAGAIVGAQTRIEDGCILNTRALVDHDVHLGACSHVAPGAALCGFITVGRETWIGAGAVVRDHLSIGARVTVGAGAVVVKNIPDGQTVYGNPAAVHARS